MTPEIPKVNHATKSADDIDRMESKIGMAFAKMNARTQKVVPIPIHMVQVRFVLRSYSCSMLSMRRTSTKMNFMDVWPNTRDVPSRVGRRIP